MLTQTILRSPAVITHNIRRLYWNLIYINTSNQKWANMIFMFKACAKGFGIARQIVVAAVFLLVPLTAFADGLGQPSPTPQAQSAEKHLSDTVADKTEHHGFPAEAPLHCHEKSPAPQAADLILEPFFPDQPPLSHEAAPTVFRATTLALNYLLARIPIAGPPRFILFSNFRS